MEHFTFDEIGIPAAQVAVARLLERARRSPTGIVPIIGPPTVDQTHSYLAALDVNLDADQYRRLDEVSRIDPGQPHNQVAEQLVVTLGGEGSGFSPPLVPSA